jgi:hypothetical protein
MDNLKGNFTNRISGNERIDNFIQEIVDDIVFEWMDTIQSV